MKGSGVPSRVAALASIAIVAAACVVNSSGTGATSKGIISIGVDLPESGAAGPLGLPTLNGVKFAVQRAGGTVSGWTLTIENRDDAVGGAYSADKGVQNVTDLINNHAVVAMVGPFNSAVGKAEIPVAAQAHLTMISPSNTNPCLTKDLGKPICSFAPADLRKDNPNDYFRVITTDDLQGPAMADYAFGTLGIKKLGVIDDKTAFGVSTADAFQVEFRRKGGAVERESFDPVTTDWRPMLNKFKSFGATAIYVSGLDDHNSCRPRAQMADLGIGDWPYLGTDGIMTLRCIDDAAASAIGISATTAGADATKIDTAASTIADFRRSFPNTDLGPYTLYAYDAANIEIAAIRKALKAGKDPRKIGDFREAIRANVARTSGFEGTVSTTTFDANGDTSAKTFSVYETKKGGALRTADDTVICHDVQQSSLCFEWIKQFDVGA